MVARPRPRRARATAACEERRGAASTGRTTAHAFARGTKRASDADSATRAMDGGRRRRVVGCRVDPASATIPSSVARRSARNATARAAGLVAAAPAAARHWASVAQPPSRWTHANSAASLRRAVPSSHAAVLQSSPRAARHAPAGARFAVPARLWRHAARSGVSGATARGARLGCGSGLAYGREGASTARWTGGCHRPRCRPCGSAARSKRP